MEVKLWWYNWMRWNGLDHSASEVSEMCVLALHIQMCRGMEACIHFQRTFLPIYIFYFSALFV